MEAKIRAFIEQGGNESAFNRLARELFSYQYERVSLYRRFCQARGVEPGRVGHWSEIPALPADAFKYDLSAAGARKHLFLSSGTTAGAKRLSRHPLSSLATYRSSALLHFEHMVLADRPGPLAVLLLGPSAESHPHSSLGRMFSWCEESFSNGEALCAFDMQGRADIERALSWLARQARGTQPVLLLGLTSAFSVLFETMRRRELLLRLPADSRMVDTGGRKGSDRALSAKGLLAAVWRFLHIPAYLCLNEYGMTEMLSQFYDDSLRNRHAGRLGPRAKVGPPWVRSLVVDPATLKPVRGEHQGILRHLDLANWETVSAIQTLDRGCPAGDGFRVLGRARGAEARGCSELLAGLQSSA